jgi:hypothetical protein
VQLTCSPLFSMHSLALSKQEFTAVKPFRDVLVCKQQHPQSDAAVSLPYVLWSCRSPLSLERMKPNQKGSSPGTTTAMIMDHDVQSDDFRSGRSSRLNLTTTKFVQLGDNKCHWTCRQWGHLSEHKEVGICLLHVVWNVRSSTAVAHGRTLY